MFRDLGRTTFKPLNTTTNLIGRYPIHMHHNRGPAVTPANGYQFTLVGNAIDGGSAATQFKWGIAIHNSHYGLIQDNVVYNYNGASIATEDGSESFNVFDHNFALRGMGEPNNAVTRRACAMGTEGVGFWFRGPNNYVRNNVAANFQNPTTEAAYGFVYQFIHLGNIAIPNFKGADPAIAGQFTTRNGNNLPLLQFDNNEAYGAMQGGFTLLVGQLAGSAARRGRAGKPDQGSEAVAHLQQGRLHVSRPEGHLRRPENPRQLRRGQPLLRQRRVLRGLFVEGDHHPQFGYPRDGRGHHGARGRLRSGTEPHHREFLSAERRQRRRPDQRVGQRLLDAEQAGRHQQHAVSTRRPGAASTDIAMVRDVANAPECLSKSG